MRQDLRLYTGSFSHPSFGPDDIAVEIELAKASGTLKLTQAGSEHDQKQDVAVQRDGNKIMITAGTTSFEGAEAVGGMLIGEVLEKGEGGGRFRLIPAPKKRTSAMKVQPPETWSRVTKTTRYHQFPPKTTTKFTPPVPLVWQAVGMPIDAHPGKSTSRTIHEVSLSERGSI